MQAAADESCGREPAGGTADTQSDRQPGRLAALAGVGVGNEQIRLRPGRLVIELPIGRDFARAGSEADDDAPGAVALVDAEDATLDDRHALLLERRHAGLLAFRRQAHRDE